MHGNKVNRVLQSVHCTVPSRTAASAARWLIALIVSVACVVVVTPRVAQSVPLAQILAPAAGTKLRANQSVAVEISVRGAEDLTWSLTLYGPASTLQLASGTSAVDRQSVADISAAMLVPGDQYELQLRVTEHGAEAIATSSLIVPDLHFRLIPMRDGGPFTKGFTTYAVSDTDQVVYSSGAGSPDLITVISADTNTRRVVPTNFASTAGARVSGDGNRLFFRGWFEGDIGLGYLDLNSGSDKRIDVFGIEFLSVDASGQRMVYQAAAPRVHPFRENYQFFLYDDVSGDHRQVTDQPGAIEFGGSQCPSQLGSTPQISSDGAKVVFLTGATLGIVPEDSSIGCRVFEYEVATERLRQVAALPATWRNATYPSLTGDGRWLAFPVSATRSTGGSRGIPVLIDVLTGEITAPIVDSGDYTSFDSTITRSGNAVIISSQADLDPRVGNADHNLELFFFDRTSGQISQITETVGGIGSTPNGCRTYRVSANADGSTIALPCVAISTGSCHLDGPQLVEENGLWLGLARAVRIRPGNSEVVFASIDDPQFFAGQANILTFSAHDEDGDLIGFYAQTPGTLDPLPGSTFKDNFDGTATFEWQPRLEDIGKHILRVAAFDEGGGEMVRDVNITVVAPGDDELICVGACTESNNVAVDDVVTLVNIALGLGFLEQCPRGDVDDDNRITIDELQTAIGNALGGCPG